MITNLLTEDNLPSYHREIAMNFGMDGAVGLLGQPLDRRGEPARHRAARLPRRHPRRRSRRARAAAHRADDPRLQPRPEHQQADLFAESLFDSVIYVTFQELATRVSHRNTGKACNETIADQLLQRVSADENLHMIFYRDVTRGRLRHRPRPGDEVAAQGAAQLQDARLHRPGLPPQGRHHRRRRCLRPAHPPRRRRDAGAEEVAHLRARGLHRRGRPDARRPRRPRRGA